MLGLAAMNKVFRILLMCDKSRGHVIVIVNGVGPCSRRGTWVVGVVARWLRGCVRAWGREVVPY